MENRNIIGQPWERQAFAELYKNNVHNYDFNSHTHEGWHRGVFYLLQVIRHTWQVCNTFFFFRRYFHCMWLVTATSSNLHGIGASF